VFEKLDRRVLDGEKEISKPNGDPRAGRNGDFTL
jgi:hypothetical protein